MKKDKKTKLTKEQKEQLKEQKAQLKELKKQKKSLASADRKEKKNAAKKESVPKEKKKGIKIKKRRLKAEPDKQKPLTEEQIKKREKRLAKKNEWKEKREKRKSRKGKMKKENPNQEKTKRSIRLEITLISIVPLVILTVIIAVYCQQALRTTLENEALTGLKDLCYSLEGTYNVLDSGEYVLDEGTSATYLRKGEYQITKDQSLLENLKELSEVEFSVYYENKIKATSITSRKTGEKIIDEEAPADVVKTVIENKEAYGTSNAIINEDEFYAYYVPIKNPGGTVVGMISACKPCREINKEIQKKIAGVLIVAFVILLFAVVIVVLVSGRIGIAVRKSVGLVGELSKGDLGVAVDAKLLRRVDELGLMAKALSGLTAKLGEVLRSIKESSLVISDASNDLNAFAAGTEKTANEVGMAVSEISQGAHMQSEEIENATEHVEKMGESIQKIVKKVESLNHTSDNIEHSKEEAESIIQELVSSSDKTYEEVQHIENQVRLTDDAVTKIGAAITLISNIADETNLLSLNASIEAARAGEAGKGFSVVASQIQKLAEESNRSAAGISKIIEELSYESKKTVEAMDEMNTILDEQQEKLQITQFKFGDVSRGIQASRNEIQEIRKDSESCEEVRDKVSDAFRNLAATSEQNAASTEQTTASMEELHHTMQILMEKSDELGALAQQMQSDLEYFKW